MLLAPIQALYLKEDLVKQLDELLFDFYWRIDLIRSAADGLSASFYTSITAKFTHSIKINTDSL